MKYYYYYYYYYCCCCCCYYYYYYCYCSAAANNNFATIYFLNSKVISLTPNTESGEQVPCVYIPQ
jgi:hypothetical protein